MTVNFIFCSQVVYWCLVLCRCHPNSLWPFARSSESYTESLLIDGQIALMYLIVRGRGNIWCAFHVCTHIKSYYLNNTCCHAPHTHPYSKTVFLSSWGLRSSLRLLQVQREGCSPQRGVCLRPTLQPWCFFQTRPVSEIQTGMGTEPASCFLTLRIRIFRFFCKFSRSTQVCLDGTHQTNDYSTHQACIVAPKMQQQFMQGMDVSLNISHAREICMQSVEAFPALFSFSWLACPGQIWFTALL